MKRVVMQQAIGQYICVQPMRISFCHFVNARVLPLLYVVRFWSLSTLNYILGFHVRFLSVLEHLSITIRVIFFPHIVNILIALLE